VSGGIVEADYWIAEDHKIRPEAGMVRIGYVAMLVMGALGRSQVSSCGKTHDAYLVRIYFKAIGMFPDILYGSLCVLKGTDGLIHHGGVVWNPVMKHDGYEATVSETFGEIRAFMGGGQYMVTTPGANDNRGAACRSGCG
jgi:hypothetical protein